MQTIRTAKATSTMQSGETKTLATKLRSDREADMTHLSRCWC
jgi:hypothetical protein